MARDLIPPPSPAGRPGSSAEAERERAVELEEQRRKQKGGGLWHRSPEDEATTPDASGALVAADPEAASGEARDLATRPDASGPTPFRSRFGLVLGALIGLGIATLAIGAAVYVGTTGDNGAPSGWSGWKPKADGGVAAARQIATHVGHEYRLGDGDQLVGVEAGPLEIDALGLSVPLSIAMRTSAQGGNIDFIKGNGLMYTLNGLGPKGSVRGGKPSEARHLLLRREALELALYTFRYIKDVDQVVALLPPAPPAEPKKGAAASTTETDPPTQALFFRPGDLEPQLEIPLGATIPAQTPRPETIPGAEARRIDALTRGNLFLASFQQSQDQKAYLVLDRLPQ
jgi:hypothetical protein